MIKWRKKSFQGHILRHWLQKMHVFSMQAFTMPSNSHGWSINSVINCCQINSLHIIALWCTAHCYYSSSSTVLNALDGVVAVPLGPLCFNIEQKKMQLSICMQLIIYLFFYLYHTSKLERFLEILICYSSVMMLWFHMKYYQIIKCLANLGTRKLNKFT